MRSIAKQSLYFSAYPLKALEQAAAKSVETVQSPYLRSLLSGKTMTRLRISPMANPYPVGTGKSLTLRPTLSNTKEPEGKEWFNHYE
ncbi:MAG TPA: hypothetical protein VK644_05205 [Chitinophagaceae bacterium]|nr:hypothetical protein [Chitinophagaceae bacterium]